MAPSSYPFSLKGQRQDLDAAVLAASAGGVVRGGRVGVAEGGHLEPGRVEVEILGEKAHDGGGAGRREFPVARIFFEQPLAQRRVVGVAFDTKAVAGVGRVEVRGEGGELVEAVFAEFDAGRLEEVVDEQGFERFECAERVSLRSEQVVKFVDAIVERAFSAIVEARFDVVVVADRILEGVELGVYGTLGHVERVDRAGLPGDDAFLARTASQEHRHDQENDQETAHEKTEARR